MLDMIDNGLEEEMAELIPAKTYIARAKPLGGRYHALFAAPGLLPDVSRYPSGEAVEFATAEEAEIEAMRALFSSLNAPRQELKGASVRAAGKPAKISSSDFAVALRVLGISPAQFSVIYGTSMNRVMQWIDGADEVPHPIRLLLVLFQRDRANIEAAMAAAQQAMNEKRARTG